MNLHYTVEKAFDDLENAIAHAELHESTSAADAERYAQLLDDVIGLHDGVKKEAAPAVGATEAEKENTSIPSIQGDGEKVKNRLVVEENDLAGGYDSQIEARGYPDLIYLYISARGIFKKTVEECGVSFAAFESMAESIDSETREVTS